MLVYGVECLRENFSDVGGDFVHDSHDIAARFFEVSDLFSQVGVSFAKRFVFFEGERVDFAELFEFAFGGSKPCLNGLSGYVIFGVFVWVGVCLQNFVERQLSQKP